MPNHIVNILEASDKVLDALRSEETLVDFNNLIPVDKDLLINPHMGVTSLAEFVCGKAQDHPMIAALERANIARDIEKGGARAFSDEDFEAFVQCLRNVRKHGFVNWYSANTDTWGTKWNAYDITRQPGRVEFQTAWSAPHPVVEELVKKFPEERIVHMWADEDIGSNLGHRIYAGGVVLVVNIDDPVCFACELHGHDPAEYR